MRIVKKLSKKHLYYRPLNQQSLPKAGKSTYTQTLFIRQEGKSQRVEVNYKRALQGVRKQAKELHHA